MQPVIGLNARQPIVPSYLGTVGSRLQRRSKNKVRVSRAMARISSSVESMGKLLGSIRALGWLQNARRIETKTKSARNSMQRIEMTPWSRLVKSAVREL
jgi:hypothetical protein